MSLRPSHPSSPARVAASRAGSQQSTGPRSAAGKAQSCWNALRHGLYASPNHDGRPAMRALGEDPEAFDRLCQRLLGSFPDADPFLEQQVVDLGHLYWRRGRAERAVDALIVEDQEGIDACHHKQRLLRQRRGVSATETGMKSTGLYGLPDSPAKFRKMLEALQELKRHLQTGEFGDRPWSLIGVLYRLSNVYAAGRLRELIVQAKRKGQGGEGVEEEQREALELIDDELDRVKGEQDLYDRDNPVNGAAEREKALVPSGDEWQQALKMLEHLDRAIDRKTRLIMDLAKRAVAQTSSLRSAAFAPAQGQPVAQTSSLRSAAFDQEHATPVSSPAGEGSHGTVSVPWAVASDGGQSAEEGQPLALVSAPAAEEPLPAGADSTAQRSADLNHSTALEGADIAPAEGSPTCGFDGGAGLVPTPPGGPEGRQQPVGESPAPEAATSALPSTTKSTERSLNVDENTGSSRVGKDGESEKPSAARPHSGRSRARRNRKTRLLAT